MSAVPDEEEVHVDKMDTLHPMSLISLLLKDEAIDRLTALLFSTTTVLSLPTFVHLHYHTSLPVPS